MNYIEIILILAVVTIGSLIFIMMKMIRKMEVQFRKIKSLELDDSYIEEKMNEQADILRLEREEMQHTLNSRIDDIEKKMNEQ